MGRKIIAGASALALASLTLSGCLGPGEPVELPEDTIEAARTCFAAQGLAMREGKGEDDPITYEEFVSAIKYPMVAAAQVEPFSADTISQVINGADKAADAIRSKDYAGAIATCDARFAPQAEVTLPEQDSDAVLSCMTLAGFMQGAVQAQGGDFGDRGATIGPLLERLQKRMESDPEILVKLAAGGDVQAIMNEAMKPAFGAGAPDAYLTSCEARFSAGG